MLVAQDGDWGPEHLGHPRTSWQSLCPDLSLQIWDPRSVPAGAQCHQPKAGESKHPWELQVVRNAGMTGQGWDLCEISPWIPPKSQGRKSTHTNPFQQARCWCHEAKQWQHPPLKARRFVTCWVKGCLHSYFGHIWTIKPFHTILVPRELLKSGLGLGFILLVLVPCRPELSCWGVRYPKIIRV